MMFLSISLFECTSFGQCRKFCMGGFKPVLSEGVASSFSPVGRLCWQYISVEAQFLQFRWVREVIVRNFHRVSQSCREGHMELSKWFCGVLSSCKRSIPTRSLAIAL